MKTGCRLARSCLKDKTKKEKPTLQKTKEVSVHVNDDR